MRSQTAFEETVERLGTAIKLGLLPPGTRLPAERELCARLGIARSTLRQALTALGAERPRARDARARRRHVRRRPAAAGRAALAARCSRGWRETCDERLAVEVGVAVLAAERAEPDDARRARRARRDARRACSRTSPPTARPTSACTSASPKPTGSPRLVRAMTEVQGAMTDLIAYIAHPPEVLASSNAQHRRLLAAVRERDAMRAARAMTEHLQRHRARARRPAARRLSVGQLSPAAMRRNLGELP